MEQLLIERARRRLSIQELAARSGVNEHTISDIERGLRKPRATTVAKLAEALGLKAEDLLGKALASAGERDKLGSVRGVSVDEETAALLESDAFWVHYERVKQGLDDARSGQQNPFLTAQEDLDRLLNVLGGLRDKVRGKRSSQPNRERARGA